MQKILKTVYEMIMILLVMVTIITLWTEDTYNSTINWIVWGAFFIDFVVRFFTAREKWVFIKENPFLLIAVIPFDQFFQVARIVRVIYLFRIKTITKYYITPYLEKLTFQSKTLILSVFVSLLVIASIVIWNLESSVSTYFDALFVIFGYLLFFGHQIFVIENEVSIWILTGISIMGIGIQGLALQWVFHRAEVFYKRFKHRRGSDIDEQSELKSKEQ
ncbi:transporter [Virgibacillus doumboii]|uniref:transporter n=1 Tax=Virgibacillus doumboii TaxID=2697503 RepID=UPI0013DECC41|nr:transporter [Virgibacillus doumboii]